MRGVLFTSVEASARPQHLQVCSDAKGSLAEGERVPAVVVQILEVPREGSVLAGSLVEAGGAP